jgi:serine/threonine protein kinase
MSSSEFVGYRVGDLPGRGGMGEVYAGWDADLGRQVALKFLLPRSVRDATA